jgi:hypothetical protein
MGRRRSGGHNRCARKRDNESDNNTQENEEKQNEHDLDLSMTGRWARRKMPARDGRRKRTDEKTRNERKRLRATLPRCPHH